MDHSPELRQAKKEIAQVLRRYNIVGTILLADGLGKGEFGNYIDLPSWSAVDLSNQPFVRFKTTGKNISSQQSAEMSINALVVMRDMAKDQFEMNVQLIEALKNHFEITENGASRVPEENLLK